MKIVNSSAIISKFITKEIEDVYKKYSNISQEEINIVSSFIDKLEDNEIFDPYLNYNATKEVAEILKDEDNIDVIKLYLFLRFDISNIELQQVRDAYNSLETNGYAEIEGYYIYYKHTEEVMKDLAKEVLDDKLDDPDKVAEMFDKEEIANMWVFGTSKEEAISQYLLDYDWWEVLGIGAIQEVFVDSNNNKICYCEME